MLISAEEARQKTISSTELFEKQRERYFEFLNNAITKNGSNAISKLSFQKGQFDPEMVKYFQPDFETSGYKTILTEDSFVIDWSGDDEKLSS